MQLHSGALDIGEHMFEVTAPAGASMFRIEMTRDAWPAEASVSVLVKRAADGSVVGGWSALGGELYAPRTNERVASSWGATPAPGGLPLPIDVDATVHVEVSGAPITTVLTFTAT